jgi:hypothetical protein
MELLGDMGLVESHFGLFGDSVSVGQDRFMVCAKHIIGSEIILDAPWYVTCVMWNPILIHLEIVSVSVNERSTVCAQCSTSSQIVFDAHDGTTR